MSEHDLPKSSGNLDADKRGASSPPPSVLRAVRGELREAKRELETLRALSTHQQSLLAQSEMKISLQDVEIGILKGTIEDLKFRLEMRPGLAPAQGMGLLALGGTLTKPNS